MASEATTSGRRAAFVAAASFFVAGCAEDRVRVDLFSFAGPPNSSLEGDQLKLARGTALVVEALPKDEDGKPAPTFVDIVAAPPFQVLRTSSKNRFVIVAESAGQAKLRIVADGNDARTLTADAL